MTIWFHQVPLPKILFVSLILVSILASSCQAGPTPTPEPISGRFSYLVQVQARETGQEIVQAEVIIQVGGMAPLDGVTDSRGIARIFVGAGYVNQPGFLIVRADGYEPYTQNIDLAEGALPDVIRLTRKGTAIALTSDTPTPTPTGEATATPPPTPTTQPLPTEETATLPTEEPSSTPTNTPTPTQTPTPEPTTEPTIEPAETRPTPPPPLHVISGRIAIPLGGARVIIADTTGNSLGRLDMARQPDYSPDGTMLLVNGDAGPLDKLRLSDPNGNSQREIGDPGLGSHSHPVWSPDGTQVMYDDDTIGGLGWRIFRRDLNNRNGPGEEIFAGPGPIVGQNPQWTTGDRIVFRGCKTWTGQAGECGVWVMQGNRGEPQKLTGNVNHILTDVHNDIAVFVTNEPDGGEDWDVYTLNIVTGQINALTNDAWADGLATISPDGRWVAFVSNREGGQAVWYVGIDGGTPKKMFDIPGNWGALAPDAWYNEKLSWGQ
jgi:Tol biopolymer transport system component